MRNLVVLSVLTLAFACKTEKTEPKTSTGSTAPPPVASVVEPGSAAPEPVQKQAQGDVILHKGDGSKPVRTKRALTDADFAELAKIQVPTFEGKVRNTSGMFEARYVTGRPHLATTISIAPCLKCTPIDLGQWKKKESSLKNMLIEELRDRPDTIWDLGKTDLNGEPMIYTFQFAHHMGKDDMGNPEGGFSNAYILYWNDGLNQIRVVAEYKDDPVTRDDLGRIAPREDLEKLARSFMDLFTHKWAT